MYNLSQYKMKLKSLAWVRLEVRRGCYLTMHQGRRTGHAPLLESNLRTLHCSAFSYIKEKDEGQQCEFTMLLDHVRNQIVLLLPPSQLNHWSSRKTRSGNGGNKDSLLTACFSLSLLLICQPLLYRVVSISHIV